MKKILCLLICLMLLLGLAGCKGKKDVPFYEEFPTGSEIITVEVEQNPTAKITLSDDSVIEMELYYNTAPNAVTDFIAYANAGLYDGMALNEVRNNCIIMLGAAEGTFTPPYYIMDEINAPDDENALSHVRGVVSMIRESSANRLTGQFFVLTKDQTHFDKRFTAFGMVTEGMDIFDKIASTELNKDGKIDEPLTIKSVKVKTYGVKFPNPTIIPNNYVKDE